MESNYGVPHARQISKLYKEFEAEILPKKFNNISVIKLIRLHHAK